MKRLDRIDLFAGAGKLDRLAGYRPHRQRRTAAGIAVHSGQDHTGQINLAGKALRNVDRILTGQRIDHQQHFLGNRDRGDGLHLVHQLAIDVEAACRIEQQHVDRLQLGRLQRTGGDIDRGLASDDRQSGSANLLAQHRQLLLRGRAIDVERRHQHLLAVLFLEQFGELRRSGGLARTLQADHHDHDRRKRLQIKLGGLFAAQHLDQRIVDDLDDLLARCDRLQDRLANRLFGDIIDKAADNRQRDIGFEQRDSNFAHRIAHILLAQRPAPAQLVENAAKAI